ncbi:MAG: peptidase M14 [Flavobacteriaceae bacterium]|jgi:hypothetical protein|nr:peptidase M14 [Flavobacteriaceae bacterium]
MSTELEIFALEQDLELEENFTTRYVSPKKLFDFLLNNYKEYLTEIGTSEFNKPIFKITIGNGEKRVLLWTQMHGNETTGTLSALDLLKFLKSEQKIAHRILSRLTLDIIFMLNPDGAEVWTRRNATGIDINRDFLTASSIEMQILKETVNQKNYSLAFNLHDQRTVFGVNGKKEPATLAFLSPSVSETGEVTETRKKSMGLIADIYKEISQILPDKISRFSDEYYSRSVGDNLQKMEIPTILFEGGHFPKDYYRQKTRKYFSLALITALYYASTKEIWEDGYEEYFTIPENSTSFHDIIYRKVKVTGNKKNVVDIAIQYTEQIIPGDDEISFIAKIEDIGDLSILYGHEEIDAEVRCFYSPDAEFPEIGMQADFQQDEWLIVNGKKLEQLL